MSYSISQPSNYSLDQTIDIIMGICGGRLMKESRIGVRDLLVDCEYKELEYQWT